MKNIPYSEIFNFWVEYYFYFADVVVINGEGNFHDNLPRHKRLYWLAMKSKKFGRRTCLINTVAQNIPSFMDLNIFDYVSVRESLSLREIQKTNYGKKLELIPDGSLSLEFKKSKEKRHGIIITDSVKGKETIGLLELHDLLKAKNMDVSFITFINTIS